MDNCKSVRNKTNTSLAGYVIRFIDDIFKDKIGVYAAQSTFFIVLSAVPLSMLLILCLKYFINIDLQYVVDVLERILPTQLALFATDILSEVFYRTETTALFSTVVITLLWSSSKGTMAIYCGLNEIFGKSKEQSWLRMRLLSFLYNILFVAIIISSIAVLLFGNSIMTLLGEQLLIMHYIITFIMEFKTIIFFVIFVLTFAAIFTFLPQRKDKYRHQLWGAVITAVGWLIASYGISIYITYFPGVSYIYGSLTAVMLLMLWLYFCIYALLIGAEINKHIESGFFRHMRVCILRIVAKKRKKM